MKKGRYLCQAVVCRTVSATHLQRAPRELSGTPSLMALKQEFPQMQGQGIAKQVAPVQRLPRLPSGSCSGRKGRELRVRRCRKHAPPPLQCRMCPATWSSMESSVMKKSLGYVTRFLGHLKRCSTFELGGCGCETNHTTKLGRAGGSEWRAAGKAQRLRGCWVTLQYM